MNKKFFKKINLFFTNFVYFNTSIIVFNFLYFVTFVFSFYTSGIFWAGIGFILHIIYFIGWLFKNIKHQRNTFGLVSTISQSPISIVIGKLGTGKTLFLTYLNQIMKIGADSVYRNYPVECKFTKIVTFKNFDFTDKTKLVPSNKSFIGFDESFLYIDGTSPKDTKALHSGKIPGILLARHFRNVAVFTAQREKMIGNNIRELASCTIIPLSLKKPSKYGFLPKFFVMEIGIFQDMEAFSIGRTKTMERIADGKRIRKRTSLGLGVQFFKIIIPLSVAKKYDSCGLSFVRDFKNDNVVFPQDFFGDDVKNLSDKEKLKLFDIDILKKNLGLKD